MLYEPSRHEALRPIRWDENVVRRTIERIVADTEAHFSEERYWPIHPLDAQDAHPPDHVETSLYDGACGVIWALHYLEDVGACALSRRYGALLERLFVDNRRALGARAAEYRGSFLLGDTPIAMMAFGEAPTAERASTLRDLIAGNIDHPARELMLGSPGTLLAALFLHERTVPGGSKRLVIVQLEARQGFKRGVGGGPDRVITYRRLIISSTKEVDPAEGPAAGSPEPETFGRDSDSVHGHPLTFLNRELFELTGQCKTNPNFRSRQSPRSERIVSGIPHDGHIRQPVSDAPSH